MIKNPDIILTKGTTMSELFTIVQTDEVLSKVFRNRLRFAVGLEGIVEYDILEDEDKEQAKNITAVDFFTQKMGMKENEILEFLGIKFS